MKISELLFSRYTILFQILIQRFHFILEIDFTTSVKTNDLVETPIFNKNHVEYARNTAPFSNKKDNYVGKNLNVNKSDNGGGSSSFVASFLVKYVCSGCSYIL